MLRIKRTLRVRRCTAVPVPLDLPAVSIADLKKPYLACDADLDNLEALTYPRAALFKKDGVRVLIKHTFAPRALGRSHKEHRNPHIQNLFGRAEYLGFDGEGIVGPDNGPEVCALSSGGFSRAKDKPKEGKFIKVDAVLHVFDLHDHPGTFAERHAAATDRVLALLRDDPTHPITIIPYEIVHNAQELLAFEKRALDLNYEGVITRTLDDRYKNGRSTRKEQGYLRMKRFEEREMTVTRIEEGSVNGNEAKKNELGHTERSSHKANMVANGMVGTIYGIDLKDGKEKKIAPGKMTDKEAAHYWANPDEIVGHVVKYKFFPVGIKSTGIPRFPTFQCFRSAEDMSE